MLSWTFGNSIQWNIIYKKSTTTNYSVTFVCEKVINVTKHNHVLYYVERVDLYSDETVIIDPKTIFVEFINAGKIITLFSYRMSLSAQLVLLLCLEGKFFWCTTRDKSRATFEIPSRWLNTTIYPILFHIWFLNCYSCSNFENPLHCNNFKNHRWNRMGFMVIFSHLEGISNVALLLSLIVPYLRNN